MSATTIIQESETATVAVGEVPGSEEVPTHISEVPEGNIYIFFVESISIYDNSVIDTDFDAGIA